MAIYMYCSRCRTRTGLNHRECNGCERPLNPKTHSKWVIEWHQNRKVYREHVSDMDVFQVKQAEQNRKIESRQGIYESNRTTLSQAIENYLKDIQLDSPSSYKVLKSHCGLVLEILGDVRTSQITKDDVQELRLVLVNEGYSPSYIRDVIVTCKNMWSYSGSDRNPFDIKLKPIDNTRQRFLSQEEEERLLQTARQHHPDLYPVLIVALETGLRKTNTLSLRWSEVDLDNQIITIRQKGGSTHSVPISDKLFEVLNQLERGSEWVFPNPRTGKPFTDLSKPFKECLRLAGVEQGFRWHDLRHTSCSKLLRKSGNIKLAQQFLGHKSINNTMRYSHLADDYLREQVNSM